MIMALGWKAIASGVVLAAGALGAVGLGLPQLATEEDVAAAVRAPEARIERLAQRLAQVDLMTTQQALESAELRALRLEREAKERATLGEDTESLDREVKILKRRTRGLEARVLELMQPKEE
jgi:hypothetical protein